MEQEIESDFEEMEDECEPVASDQQLDQQMDVHGWREDGLQEEEGIGNVDLKRGNSTNDSGYSSYHPDSDTASDDEIPLGWEESAGYNTTTIDDKHLTNTTVSHISLDPSQDAIHYLHSERQESSYISNLLRSHPFDEWSEWRKSVTKLLMIPEEDSLLQSPHPVTPPQTPTASGKLATETQKSPSRRRSLFNFSRLKDLRAPLLKRKSVLW